MLARGDRRIYNPRSMSVSDPWCLISFSIPRDGAREAASATAQAPLDRLRYGGRRTVDLPDSLRVEVEEILADLDLRSMATIFVAATPLVGGSLQDAASKWWDLEAVAELHRDFIRQHTNSNSNSNGELPRHAGQAMEPSPPRRLLPMSSASTDGGSSPTLTLACRRPSCLRTGPEQRALPCSAGSSPPMRNRARSLCATP